MHAIAAHNTSHAREKQPFLQCMFTPREPNAMPLAKPVAYHFARYVLASFIWNMAAHDLPAQSAPMAGHRLVDLTHPFDDQTIYWPTERGFELDLGEAGFTDRGYFYAANRFRAAEHGGTHIDAPIHFFEGRNTVEQIPLERLIGPGVVVDVSEKCAADADYQITPSDLRAWETEHRRELNDVIVLLRTGWSRHWPDRAKYLGTEDRGEEAVAKLHFPGLHPSAAQWLAQERRVKAVGIDTASIDHGQSRRFQSHVTLFEQQIPALENIAYLDQLPVSGFTVIALPMKIAGGSGAPLRIVAVINE
jgi:kynurenine formamidase